MTTIDIHDWQGTELLNDFIDYVNTGTANGIAIASRDTGNMVDSVTISPIRDGYKVDVDYRELFSRSKAREYYPYIYAIKGYANGRAPFHFLYEGFMRIGDGDSIGTAVNWVGVGGRGRRDRGSGWANISSIKIPVKVARGWSS